MERKNSVFAAEGNFYRDLVVCLHNDIAQCYEDTDTVLVERRYLLKRYEEEGLPFLTVTLPSLGKAIDKALASNTRLATSGFELRPESRIPLFLGGIVERVFDAQGWELCNSDPMALKDIRQLCTLLYKLEIPYDEETEKSVLIAFTETDANLCRETVLYGPLSDWIVQARKIVTRVVSGLDPSEIIPGHGPGAVATGEKVTEKSNLRRIYPGLEQVYPFTEYMMFNLNHVAESLPRNVCNTHWVRPRGQTQYLEHLEVCEPLAKVVLVPKDSRGPRLISCEPLEIQNIQQGIKKILQKRIESSKWTRGQVNFTDQTINQKMALLGSMGRGWVTLDMKDASDRVSRKLVEILFAEHPRLLAAIMAARSTGTRLPDGSVVRLKKFAPMGSSLCFPVESLVFYALAVSSIKMNRRMSWRQARKDVFVYGDDIIVREEDYHSLLQNLPRVGLKFNPGKCCTGRFYRESCGCDAYKGVDITPVKVKTRWSLSPNPETLPSYCALYNAMMGLGHLGTCEMVRSALEAVYGYLPRTNLWEVARNGTFVSQASCPALCSWEAASTLNLNLPSRPVRSRKGEPFFGHGIERFVWLSVPIKWYVKQDTYAEMLRRYCDGWPQSRGAYTVPRRNRLKRGWVVVR